MTSLPPTLPPTLAIIRMCHDHLAAQMYAFRDTTGALWYGGLTKDGSVQAFRLAPEALNQVCPDSDAKKDSPA